VSPSTSDHVPADAAADGTHASAESTSALASSCQDCGATLTSSIVCLACGALQRRPGRAAADPFAVLGLEPRFALDRRALRKRLLELQRAVHPDFFATRGPEARSAAEDATSQLNRAFEVLNDEQRLGDELVRRLGGPSQDEERQMPQSFLMEVLEWNEVLDEARAMGASADQAALADLRDLRDRLGAARAEALAGLASDLEPLPEHGAPRLRRARQSLNALRYVERALADIERLTG